MGERNALFRECLDKTILASKKYIINFQQFTYNGNKTSVVSFCYAFYESYDNKTVIKLYVLHRINDYKNGINNRKLLQLL